MRRAAFLLSLLFIFVIPWENAVVIPSLGTISRLVGLGAAAVWLLAVLTTRRLRAPTPFHLLVLLFVLWNALSIVWSINPSEALVRLVTYAQLLGLVFLLWDLYDTPEAFRSGLQAYVLGAYVSVVATVAALLGPGGAGQIRYSAPGFDPNDLGLSLALGIAPAWHLATSGGRHRILRLLDYAYVPAAILAILLTASRAALVCGLVSLSFVLWSLLRARVAAQVFALLLLVAGLFSLQMVVPETSLQRLSTAGESIAAGDLNGRVAIWREGLAASARHPLLGVGSNGYRYVVPSGRVAHNLFVSVLVEVGIIGLGLFLLVLAAAVHAAVSQPRWHAQLWLTVLATWALGVGTLTWEYRKPTWLVLSFAVGAAALHREVGDRVADPAGGPARGLPGLEPG